MNDADCNHYDFEKNVKTIIALVSAMSYYLLVALFNKKKTSNKLDCKAILQVWNGVGSVHLVQMCFLEAGEFSSISTSCQRCDRTKMRRRSNVLCFSAIERICPGFLRFS